MASLKCRSITPQVRRLHKYQIFGSHEVHYFNCNSTDLQLSGSKMIVYPASRPRSPCKTNVSVHSSYAFSSPVEYGNYTHVRQDFVPKMIRMNQQILGNIKGLAQTKGISKKLDGVDKKTMGGSFRHRESRRVRSKSRQKEFREKVNQLIS